METRRRQREDQQLPQAKTIKQVPAPVGLVGLVSPGPVSYGPDNPISPEVQEREHEYFRIIKKAKGVTGVPLVTSAEFVEACKRKTAIDVAAAQQKYPDATAPAWFRQFSTEMTTKLDDLKTDLEDSITSLREQLTGTAQLPFLIAKNVSAFSPEGDGILHRLPAPTGDNIGKLPPQGVYFPASVVAINTMTTVQLDALQTFYDTQFAGATVVERRDKFKLFVTGKL